MKKTLVLFLLAGVLASAAVTGLSVIPHAHGDDFDHSQHTACPVYQAGLHGHDALPQVFFEIVFAAPFVFVLLTSRSVFHRRESNLLHFLRAPPALA